MASAQGSEFKEKLSLQLLQLCREKGLLPQGELLQSPDMDQMWQALAPEFLSEAVPEFNGYPEVVLAWAAYLGAAVAWGWDKDWDFFRSQDYAYLCGPRGFDYMDEYITSEILGMPLESDGARSLANAFRSLATAAYSALLHSGAEAGSAGAFTFAVDAMRVMYDLGAAIELYALGYKWSQQ